MSDVKSLLELRKKAKAKKPNFIMQDSHKKPKLKKKWRRPKGLQSKIRLSKKGYRKKVSQGYRSPKQVRGIHSSGLSFKIVNSVNQLSELAKDVAIVIASNVGLKKRTEIVKEAEKKNIRILNIKDTKAFLEKVDKYLDEKKKKKEAVKKEKEKKAEEKKKKAESVEKKEKEEKEEKEVKEKSTDLASKVEVAQETEEKKVSEKKEMDKQLIKGS